jgi:hypothetical protein
MAVNVNEYCFGTDGGYYIKNDYYPEVGYSDGYSFNMPKKEEKSEKILGYTYGYMANAGEISSPKGIHSQEMLYELGNNWVCLAVTNYQKTYYSTHIYSDYVRTISDRDIEKFVRRAHAKNVKVCLKPMLNSEDEIWRAYIKFPDKVLNEYDTSYWKEWFDNYKHFMLKYAELAEELGVEMLCIGCELMGTEHRKYEWLYLIDEIRKIYSGKLVYNSNHDHEEDAEWISALDYIGTSAYYPVGENGNTKEDMKKEWEKVKERMNELSDKLGKPYLFMEIGCRSAEGASKEPWAFDKVDLEVNEQEQANFYESCLEVFLPEERFGGMLWWDWSTYIYDTKEEAKNDNGFGIHLKKAEEVVKKFYKKYK